MDDAKAQRRQDFRVEVAFSLWYRRISGDGEEEWIPGVTRDLSGGGASFRVGGDTWVPDDLLEIQIAVRGALVFAIAKVLRVFADKESRPCIAVMFVSLAEEDKDKIVSAVLREGVSRR